MFTQDYILNFSYIFYFNYLLFCGTRNMNIRELMNKSPG